MEYKYLGVWIDQRLTFKTEVDYLRTRAMARVNVMKAMTHHTAGASSAVLRLFYIHAIRPIIDYAAPALTSIAATWQLQLNTIQHLAMRTIVGAPPWTQTGTLEAETGLVPLNIRVKQLTAGRVGKVLRDQNTVIRNCLAGYYDPSYNNSRKWGPQTARAFATMVIDGPEHATNSDPPDPGYTSPPPWTSSIITYSHTLLPGTRAECFGAEMRQHALQSMEALHTPGERTYYTDGSVDPSTGATGSAYVIDGEVTSWRNNNFLSTLQTELVAIGAALVHAEGGPGITVTIHTDSKAALQTLQRTHHSDNVGLVTSILARAQTLAAQGTRLRLNWIPSHVGLAGNERADEAARLATKLPNPTSFIRPSLSHIREQARKSARTQTRSIHEGMIMTSPSMKWYHQVTNFEPLAPDKHQNRATTVAIHRLRLGYRSWADIQPEGDGTICKHCNTLTDEPLLHYVLRCPATVQLRLNQPDVRPAGRREEAADIVKQSCKDPQILQAVLKRFPPPR